MKRHIIVDLDGTVCNSDHREEFALAQDWDKFHSLCYLDPPYQDVIEMLRHISHLTLIGCTGRNERNRDASVKWLIGHGLYLDHLLMRPDNGDNAYLPAGQLKIALLESFFGGREAVLNNVLFVIDDTDRVVTALRNYGLTVLQPRIGSGG